MQSKSTLLIVFVVVFAFVAAVAVEAGVKGMVKYINISRPWFLETAIFVEIC